MERLSMMVVVMVVAGVVGGWKKAQSRRDGMGWDGWLLAKCESNEMKM